MESDFDCKLHKSYISLNFESEYLSIIHIINLDVFQSGGYADDELTNSLVRPCFIKFIS